MSGRVLRGSLDPSSGLTFDRPTGRADTELTIEPRLDGVKLNHRVNNRADGPDDTSLDLKQTGTTEQLGNLRIWLRGDGARRTLFVRDHRGQTIALPLKPLREFLDFPDALQASNLHHQLGDLVESLRALRQVEVGSVQQLIDFAWFDVVETAVDPEEIAGERGLSRCADSGKFEVLSQDGKRLRARYITSAERAGTDLRNGDVVELSVKEFRNLVEEPMVANGAQVETPSLAVMAPKGSIPMRPVNVDNPIEHEKRSRNIATLTSFVESAGMAGRDVAHVYDAMVESVWNSLVEGEPAKATRITIASIPEMPFPPMFITQPEYLAHNCDVVFTLQGDRLSVKSRLGMTESYGLRREGNEVVVCGRENERTLDALLFDVLGFRLSLQAKELLSSLEVGGHAFKTPDGSVSLLGDGQAGAVVSRDGNVRGLFTNQHSNRVPSGHDLLFGYHSHPAKVLTNADPSQASSSDLSAFSRAAEVCNRAVPQLIWFQSDANQITARIFVPQKGEHGWETPSEPSAQITVTA